MTKDTRAGGGAVGPRKLEAAISAYPRASACLPILLRIAQILILVFAIATGSDSWRSSIASDSLRYLSAAPSYIFRLNRHPRLL